jgi:hypothetical protein
MDTCGRAPGFVLLPFPPPALSGSGDMGMISARYVGAPLLICETKIGSFCSIMVFLTLFLTLFFTFKERSIPKITD